MGENSKIEWTHHTFNPWVGCTKVSAGCANCYAEREMDHHWKKAKWGPRGTRTRTAPAYWRQPLQWNAAAAAAGERHRVFCASLADVFEGADTMPAEAVADVRRARLDLFDLIRRTPSLDWLLLTKRPELVMASIEQAALDCSRNDDNCEMLNAWLRGWPPANVWMGATAEGQAEYDERAAALAKIPAVVRFWSLEPLLGSIQLHLGDSQRDAIWRRLNGFGYERRADPFHWFIVGGESGGPDARPMHPDWVRSLRDQCHAAGVPFFFKQWGERNYWPVQIEDRPHVHCIDGQGGDWALSMRDRKVSWLAPLPAPGLWTLDQNALPRTDLVEWRRVGKKAAGRLLDGREWSEFPRAAGRVGSLP